MKTGYHDTYRLLSQAISTEQAISHTFHHNLTPFKLNIPPMVSGHTANVAVWTHRKCCLRLIQSHTPSPIVVYDMYCHLSSTIDVVSDALVHT